MSTIEITQSKKRTITEGLQPLPPGKALLHFTLIGIGFRLSVYVLQPYLLEQGLSRYEAFVVSFAVPFAILFALAFGMAKNEGVPEQARAMAARFRLRRIIWRGLLWVFVAFLIAIAAGIFFAPTINWLFDAFPILNPPPSFPVILDPQLQNQQLPAALKSWLGPDVIGDMGMILPIFHLFIYPWYLIYGLPITLAISFVAQKTGNTWTAILLHALANFSIYALMAGVIAGVV